MKITSNSLYSRLEQANQRRSQLYFFKTKKGNTVPIKSSMAPEISGNVQQAPIKTDNQFKIITKYEVAHTLPKHAQSSSVEILIGNDYYNDFMSTEKIKIHEGLHIIKSNFGWMVNGWTKTKEVSKDENRMLIMTHWDTWVYPCWAITEAHNRYWRVLEARNNWYIIPEKTKNDDIVI